MTVTDVSAFSPKTLIVAVKAVHRQANELEEAVKDEDNPDLHFLQMELMEVSNAETELKHIYETLQRESDNLPLYKRLIASA